MHPLYVLAVFNALLGWVLARGVLTRSMWPFYVPLAAILTWLPVHDASRLALRQVFLPAIVPYSGLARAAFHIDQALLLSWPAALIASAVVIFLRRPAWPVAVGWLATASTLAVLYPTLRDGQLLTTYAVVSLLSCAVVCGIALARFGEAWIQHQASLLLITSGEAIANVAYLFGDPVRDWDMAQTAHATSFGLVLCYQAAQIVRYWRRREP